MKITAITIDNVRGFHHVPFTQFSESINVFIGSNNAGKTTILNSIFQLQRTVFGLQDITKGQGGGLIQLYFSGEHPPSLIRSNNDINRIIFNIVTGERSFGTKASINYGWGRHSPETEPDNLIYPYLSKRKTVGYTDTINESNANSVTGNFQHLYSKIDRLITPQFQPGNKQYIKACEDILGFQVSSLAKGAGKQAVYFVHNNEHIPLTAMGEGVANILGLITDLCIAEDKIFLIEEPENDIHPKALKELLKLIIQKSKTNQFFISTHSNIVMKYLGANEDSKLFHISSKVGEMPTRPNLFISSIAEVSSNPEDRRKVLEDLGYDFFDFDLWSCWLFLEESSAEVLIKNYFIGWFVKPLSNKLRTFSAGGSTEIEPKFEDFNKLFVFLHLEPAYKNKVWVIIDKGDEENKIIERLKAKYVGSGWNASNFTQFEKHDFELYYPKRFKTEVSQVLAITDKKEKRKEKKILLDSVLDWIKDDEAKAKEEFKESATEVIDKLKGIGKAMLAK